jgi:hypothetical protein
MRASFQFAAAVAGLLLLPLIALADDCSHRPDGHGGSVCDHAGALCDIPNSIPGGPTHGTCKSVGSIADSRSCECVAAAAHSQLSNIIVASIGDSYASGEGAPDRPGGQTTSTWGGNNSDASAVMCHRSTRAAPAIAANALRQAFNVAFLQFACTGSTVPIVISTQLAPVAAAAGPAPIDALLVSIGGNDIGFSNVVVNCMIGPCEPAATTFPQTINNLAPTLMSLVTAIRGAFPGGVKHVFLTEYPDPSTTPFPGPAERCGSPFPLPTPNMEGFDALNPGEEIWAVDNVIQPLNAALTSMVDQANASETKGTHWHFVGGISNAFHGHGYCMGIPNPWPYMLQTGRMINTPVDSLASEVDIRGTMHPNQDGQSAAGAVLGQAVLQALTSPSSTTSTTNTSNTDTSNKKPDHDTDTNPCKKGQLNCVQR